MHAVAWSYAFVAIGGALGAVARFAAAGRDAMLEHGADGDRDVKLLLEQLDTTGNS